MRPGGRPDGPHVEARPLVRVGRRTHAHPVGERASGGLEIRIGQAGARRGRHDTQATVDVREDRGRTAERPADRGRHRLQKRRVRRSLDQRVRQFPQFFRLRRAALRGQRVEPRLPGDRAGDQGDDQQQARRPDVGRIGHADAEVRLSEEEIECKDAGEDRGERGPDAERQARDDDRQHEDQRQAGRRNDRIGDMGEKRRDRDENERNCIFGRGRQTEALRRGGFEAEGAGLLRGAHDDT